MILRAPLTQSALCLLLLSTWSGCDRSPKNAGADDSGSSATASAPATAAAAPANPLVAKADQLGMAGRVPRDVSLYLGSANLKPHLETLRKTEYWKTLEALIEDKTPTGEAKKSAIPMAGDTAVDDFFIVLGSDSAPALRWLIDLNRVYGEYTYRTLITGFTGGAAKASSFDPGSILANAASSPELVERICSLLESAELPPLMAGIKTANPEETLRLIFPADPKDRPAWTAALTEGKLTTDTGAELTTFEGTLATWIPPAQRQEWLETLTPLIKDPTLLARVQQTLEILAAKKFSVAVGVMDGYVLAAAGKDLSHVKFAATPGDSLLARPEMAVAHPHAGKSVLGLFHVDAGALTALHDDQPFTPMLQSALGGLGGVPLFSAMTAQVQPKLTALAAAEKDFYRYTFADADGILWWDGGLHFDMTGGFAPEGFMLDRPLQFSALLDTPDAVFTKVGHSPTSVAGRAYFERWMELVYVTAGGFIQAGLGGDQALGIYALADKGGIPPLVSIYNASKTLYQTGLGTESAFIVDLKGSTVQLPTTPPPAPGQAIEPAKVPRITSVYEVSDRAVLTNSWKSIETSLNQIFMSLPTPLPPMAPMSSERNGLTTWYYPLLALGGNDLMPCVSVSDKVFMLGTSQNLHNEVAARIAQPPAAPLTGTHYRLSFAPIRSYLQNTGPTSVPGVSAEKAGTALPWIAPFGDLRGQITLQDGLLRNTFHLQAKDVRRQVD